MKNQLLSMMAIAAMLLSCSKTEESTPAAADIGTDGVSFKSEVVATRSTSQFDSSSTILVTKGEESKEYVNSASDAGVFTSSDPFKRDGAASSFYAAYPASATTGAKDFTFAAAADQSAGIGDYDLLLAKAEGVGASANEVALTFDHAMTKITINVTGERRVDSLILNMCNQVAVASGVATTSGDATAITPYEGESGVYQAILAPQTLAEGDCVATLATTEGDLEWTPYEDVDLEAGKTYTFTWNTVSNEVTFEGAEDDITSWNEGGNNIYSSTTAIVPKTSWAAFYETDDWSDSGIPTLGGDVGSAYSRPIYGLWDYVYNNNAENSYHAATTYTLGTKCITIDLGAEYSVTRVFISKRSGSYNNHLDTFNLYGTTDITQAMIDAETDGTPVLTEENGWSLLIENGSLDPANNAESLGYTVDANGDTITNGGGGAWVDIDTNYGMKVRYIRLLPLTNAALNGNTPATNAFSISEVDVECLVVGDTQYNLYQ